MCVTWYDELGRLIAVIDTGGDTATYTYDAVGNVLSIGRYASTAVSVISFVPPTGPVGTVVTISGTGFSATPASNTVTFNGTTAAVSTASATQLAVTVPSGATTGLIAVTAPAGSDSSSSSFTVAAPAAPTITSFSPTVAAAGASITISGTNFQTTAPNNRLQFNLTGVGASSSTITSISTTAPTHTASGKIKVATPFGQDLSDDDFFVAPAPYVGSDVLVTGRMSYSQATGVAITTANKIGLIVFDGEAGHRVSLKVAPGPTSLVRLFAPNANILGSYSSGLIGIIEPVVLPKTGTYAVLVDPISTSTGTVTITAYNVPADTTATITPGGSAATVTLNTPGQNGSLTFSGTADQRVSLKMDAGGVGSAVSILNPAGGTVASTTMGGGLAMFFEPATLPTTGTYSVFVNPIGANTGSGTLTAYDVDDDVTGTITAGGSSQSVPITSQGQNGFLTFSGTSGQRVSLKIDAGAPGGMVSLLKPNGTSLGLATMGGSAGFMDTQTLADTGTHTVKVDPLNWNIGTAVVTLYSVTDVTGSLTLNASPQSVSISTPGQNGLLTFSGTGSQAVTVRVTGNNMPVTVRLLKPDGTTLASQFSSSTNFNLSQQTLPTTGTYTVKVDPSDTATGGLSLQVTNP